MSNAEAAVTIGLVYQDLAANPDFATDFPGLPLPVALLAPHANAVRAPYTVVTVGVGTVANGTETDETVDLDLGDIETEVTAFVLRNGTALDVLVSINGDTPTWSLPPGAVIAYAAPAGSATTPITAIGVVTTDTQVGDQNVDFIAFGDPA